MTYTYQTTPESRAAHGCGFSVILDAEISPENLATVIAMAKATMIGAGATAFTDRGKSKKHGQWTVAVWA